MMKRTPMIGAAAFTALGILTMSSVALASSHREAPAIADDPAADNTDLYAFVNGANLEIVANYIGLELPEGGPNWAKFSDDVLYEVHIARGPSSLADVLTYQIQFKTAKPVSQPIKQPLPGPGAGAGQEFFAQLTNSGAFNQTYTVTQLTNGANPTVIAKDVKVAPPNVGPETNTVAYKLAGTYESAFVDTKATSVIGALMGGGQVFAGPRDDPFFVDLGAVFDLAQLRPVANKSEADRDSIAFMNVHAIVLEIPVNVANGGQAPVMGTPKAAQTVGVWASASRRKVSVLRHNGTTEHFGPWQQVSRLGLPLINEAVIGLQDKDGWNRLTPADDAKTYGAYFDNPVIVRDAAAVGLYGSALAGCPNAGSGGPQTNRLADIGPVINVGIGGPGKAHTGAEAIMSVGDVLRVDLGLASGFPNGRLLTDDVVSTELSMLLCELQAPVPGGPTANETTFKATFPWLATPWEGQSANPRPIPSLP